MSIFSRQREPIFLKETSSIKEQLECLKSLLETAPVHARARIEQDIRLFTYGAAGEDNIIFELKNSHMPMYVLQDLYYEWGDLTAQIDFLVVTRKINFMIECKNLFGDIEITNTGDFVRTMEYGGKKHKEGLYSPVTQNKRHMDLFREMRAESKSALSKSMYLRWFDTFNKSVIVLANPKTVLNVRRAPKDIVAQVIRSDQLISHMKKAIDASKEMSFSDKEMEGIANRFLSFHKTCEVDYTKKYRLDETPQESSAVSAQSGPVVGNTPVAAAPQSGFTTAFAACPFCGGALVLRKGKFGAFYGCTAYPKCRFTRKAEQNEAL